MPIFWKMDSAWLSYDVNTLINSNKWSSGTWLFRNVRRNTISYTDRNLWIMVWFFYLNLNDNELIAGDGWFQVNINTVSLLFFQLFNNEIAEFFVSLFDLFVQNYHMEIALGFTWRDQMANISVEFEYDSILGTKFLIYLTIFDFTMCGIQAFFQAFWCLCFSFD